MEALSFFLSIINVVAQCGIAVGVLAIAFYVWIKED